MGCQAPPTHRIANAQLTCTVPWIDYSARPGATRFFIVACDCVQIQASPLKNTLLMIGLGRGLAGGSLWFKIVNSATYAKSSTHCLSNRLRIIMQIRRP